MRNHPDFVRCRTASVKIVHHYQSMPDVANSLARALIATHGGGAIRFAEEALRNVRALAMEDRVAEWERVIATITAMQKAN